MELTLLGTAAAEGWPAPFCVCLNCEAARRRGGVNLRTRSGALVDDDLKIDFCPDTVVQMQQTGRSLARLETLVFTHQHSDHIIPQELWWVERPFTQTPPARPITLCGNAQVLKMVEEQLGDMPAEVRPYVLRLLEPLRPMVTPSGDEILPLPAEHIEGALVLRIRRSAARGGATIFYGHDSGLYPPETLDALAAGPPLDVALFDCTNGGQTVDYRGHMSVSGVVQMAAELRRRGCATGRTRLIATHFSHNGGLLHEELVQAFLPHGIEVGFDGMVVRT
ncbi:MAG: hypothetical protein K8T26_19190 [Lentisphaerae bacterium]|nr:hypothetical protein [Lentisphaerota bacterium]